MFFLCAPLNHDVNHVCLSLSSSAANFKRDFIERGRRFYVDFFSMDLFNAVHAPSILCFLSFLGIVSSTNWRARVFCAKSFLHQSNGERKRERKVFVPEKKKECKCCLCNWMTISGECMWVTCETR